MHDAGCPDCEAAKDGCEDEQTADPRPAGERDGLGQSIPEGEQPPEGLETQGASGMGSPAGTVERMSDPIKALAESSAWCAEHLEEIERLRAENKQLRGLVAEMLAENKQLREALDACIQFIDSADDARGRTRSPQ